MLAKTIRNLAVAMAACALLPATAVAQAAPAAQSAKPAQAYFNLYDAMIGGMDLSAMTDIAADSIYDGLVRNDPSFGALAKDKPQLRDKFRAAARPFLSVWLGRATTVRRGQIAQNLAAKLTPADAQEIADFYSSPLGKKMLLAITRNLSLDSTVDTSMAGQASARGAQARQADENRTMSGAMRELMPTLTPAEQAQMMKYSQKSSFSKLHLVGKAFADAPEPGFDEISTPEERDGFKQAIAGIFAEAKNGN